MALHTASDERSFTSTQCRLCVFNFCRQYCTITQYCSKQHNVNISPRYITYLVQSILWQVPTLTCRPHLCDTTHTPTHTHTHTHTTATVYPDTHSKGVTLPSMLNTPSDTIILIRQPWDACRWPSRSAHQHNNNNNHRQN